MKPKAELLATRLLAKLKPPEDLRLSEWANKNIELPPEKSARAGRYRNWPYMDAIFDAIGGTQYERVSVMKSARIGYTQGLVIAIGSLSVTSPGPMMLLMPTDEDAVEISVDEVGPLFESTPALKGLVRKSQNGANNLRNKQLATGASLKIRSGRAPRKLRRLDIKYLFIDEVDGFEITKEGDPIALATARTLARTGRKIIAGSTPTDEGVSAIEALFDKGNQQIYEVPCPECGTFTEIEWEQIKFVTDDSGLIVQDAYWECPHCRGAISERWKPQMIANGRWRALRPEVTDHASFRINALVSMIANATWPKLARLFLECKADGPSKLKVFRNTILGKSWRTSIGKIDASSLAARGEPFGLSHHARLKPSVPPEVLAILAGSDVQDDRIEVTLLGVGLRGQKCVLGHLVFEGNTLAPEVWKRFDHWHRDFTIVHPHGWLMQIDAMAVDSGGREGRTQVVYDWCGERLGRMIYAIKGEVGPNKRTWRKAQKVKGGARLAILAVDVLKTQVLDALAADPRLESGEYNPHALRFSDQLLESWFEQVTNETRRIKYVDKRPVIHFMPKREGARVEALDCMVYAFALLDNPTVKMIDLHARSLRRPIEVSAEEKPKAKRKSLAEIAQQLNGKGTA